MKAVTLILAAICLAQAAHVPTQTADKAHLIKQKSIYELFWHNDQPTVYHPELYQKARSFNLEDHISSFTDQVYRRHPFNYKQISLKKYYLFDIFQCEVMSLYIYNKIIKSYIVRRLQ